MLNVEIPNRFVKNQRIKSCPNELLSKIKSIHVTDKNYKFVKYLLNLEKIIIESDLVSDDDFYFLRDLQFIFVISNKSLTKKCLKNKPKLRQVIVGNNNNLK